jgi:hypothetical protein
MQGIISSDTLELAAWLFKDQEIWFDIPKVAEPISA